MIFFISKRGEICFFLRKTILVFAVMINSFTFLIRLAPLLWKVNLNSQFFSVKNMTPWGWESVFSTHKRKTKKSCQILRLDLGNNSAEMVLLLFHQISIYTSSSACDCCFNFTSARAFSFNVFQYAKFCFCLN